MRDFLRSITPGIVLNWVRKAKKEKRRQLLKSAQKNGDILTKSAIISDLKALGLQAGDTVLVHASMGNIGFLEEGPKTVVDALLEVVGPAGNLVMPTSPVAKLQYDYMGENPVFDVRNTPSAMGSISEYFRVLPGVERSMHPTEPLSAIGPQAHWLTKDHFGELTPYTQNSPFYRVAELDGKILLLGVTVWVSTSLHVLEDAVPDFTFPIYHDTIFEAHIVDAADQPHTMKTKVHNPVMSNRRKCGGLQSVFDRHGITTHGNVGKAASQVLSAKGKLRVMVEEYCKNGVTMYTPEGIPDWQPLKTPALWPKE
ncbi:MAG: AAC(3) family N-acetyltransferase [Schleiferiaceae bacterium]|nr:AAC(3) family N-acetyltransferase [Schleiferiaceae bacterium]